MSEMAKFVLSKSEQNKMYREIKKNFKSLIAKICFSEYNSNKQNI